MILAKMKRLAVLLVFLVGCTNLSNQPATGWPTTDWPVSTPAEQSLNPAVLDEMLVHIDDTGLKLHSLLVVRNGKIVLEKYYPGHQKNELHVQYSVTKSFVATLFGIAVDQGKLSGVDLKVSEYFRHNQFANPDLRKEEMSLENLLTMSSGLDWIEADQTYSAMYRSKDWVDYVMGLPVADDPGKSFRYCSGCSHVLLKIIEQAVGSDAEKYAEENLFKPLGINHFRWERTPQRDPIGGWGLYLTARDMAKLGYLYLHNGEWDGKQVVSKAWVHASIVKRLDTDGRLGYGYYWWIYPTHGAYAALGRDGQTIFVIPDLELIVVTTAQIRDHDPVFDLIDNYIIPAASN